MSKQKKVTKILRSMLANSSICPVCGAYTKYDGIMCSSVKLGGVSYTLERAICGDCVEELEFRIEQEPQSIDFIGED